MIIESGIEKHNKSGTASQERLINAKALKEKKTLKLGELCSSIEVAELDCTVKDAATNPSPSLSDSKGFTLVKTQVKSEPATTMTPGLKTSQNRSVPVSAVPDNIVGTQEAIVERAKQEAAVMQRVSELRKDGLWSSRRLPKVQEPSRNKAHWDYLLEEMQWLAADFAQERKWKKAGARKIASMISKYHKEQQQKELRAERDEVIKLKRISSNLAKMVKEFWSNIEKVVEFKQQSRLQEKRKKALDLHLSFIVDQTEKYSTWLTEGLGSSAQCSTATSPSGASQDRDFEPNDSDSDDEETINEEEASGKDEGNTLLEVQELQKEMELPIEELLKTLPQELLDKPASIKSYSDSEESDHEKLVKKPNRKRKASDDFAPGDEESGDEEETLDKEEELCKEDESQELNELQQEGDLPLEDLIKKYAPAYDSDFEMPSDSESESVSNSSTECSTSESSEEEVENKENEDIGMEYLMKDLDKEPTIVTSEKNERVPGKDLTDIAAAAESIQPTGYTLETTRVKTPIPFLLKHTLREYQVVGLDWMATMYERRLNGILADEMGLGKTIQTIALLSHLACEKGVWGPHLIVVPTSVMLNWEMEFKKWCPSFKILTYFGNQKERKAKRTGWTKTNAFHVCITSYKLVIQDHQAFRRKKWRYFILDEAQNIKNFKSQRWQTLLNFNSQRRLLLTGTPLQNNLMELWSLMHFLMPNVFQSHREFKEWFANPLTGMIEGSREYNENLIKRLHKVLRPFLLRRLKQDVEKQMPKKYEHIVRCHLSRRQRFLYDDFMAQAKTKETLATGHYMSVINILMQLRKVCNHPNLFDPRPIVSPFQMEGLTYTTPSIVLDMLAENPMKVLDLNQVFPCLAELELRLPAFVAHRIRRLQTPYKLIEEIDNQPEPQPRPPPIDKPLKVTFSGSPLQINSDRTSPFIPIQQRSTSPVQSQSHQSGTTPATVVLSSGTTTPSSSSQPITVQIQNTPQGTRLMIPSGQLSQLPGYIQIVQTSSGQQIIATSQPPPNPTTGNTGVKTVAPTHIPVTSSQEADLSDQKSVITSHPKFDTPSQNKTRTLFYSEQLEEKRNQRHRHMVQRISKHNKRNCELKPVYGSDLFDAVNAMQETKDLCHSRWKSLGYIHCHNVHNCYNPNHPSVFWNQTKALQSVIHTPGDYLEELRDILERYTFATPTVTAQQISMRAFHPPPSLMQAQKVQSHILHLELSHKFESLHRINSNMTVQFPEVRLIQYDCGKLQTLDILLRKLKSGHHRVLIFTQMTRMLDVLEAFLNYHGHRYLRLDGTTKVEQRQALMERFNADKRIFVFILSTRSGGLGVNLTGADTVIFYDSDWNPTMDAQAQDRCHRIGQTRDVHIYRLISEKTIEENILKKANQKRLLSDVTIEGGNFTTAFFRQNTIQELFQEPSGLDALVKENAEEPAKVPAKPNIEQLANEEEKKKKVSRPPSRASGSGSMTEDLVEQALGAAEDEGDVQAAKSAKAEQSAELAEFDENIPWDEKEAEQKKATDEVLSRVEQELAMLQKELTPVERYAVAHLEEELAPVQVDELEKAEEEVTLAKEEWELNRLKALKEEEERRAELEEDEMLFTYSWEDANNQIYLCEKTSEQMPMWAPPTPPQDDNDLYIDQSVCFLYEQNVMPETQLPPVYIKKEHKRVRVDPAVAVTRKHKVRKEEQARVPKSLFDRPVSLLRRDAKLKLKQGFGMRPFKPSTPMLTRPVMDTGPEHPEWLIHEDWALLQAVQNLLELPLGLSTGSPGHIPNWDMVADVVNSASRVFRAPKQCKNRYENVIIPREEGRILYDVNPRKQKKTKGIYKVYHTKNNRPMKTCQLYAQDNSQALSTLYSLRFDSCKCISAKRTPTMRPTLANPTLKNPKHAAVLGENGINYEQPLTPIQVAQIRADRIAKEKKEQQLQAVQKSQVVQNTTAVTGVTQSTTVVTQAGQPQLTVVQGQQQIQAVPTVAGTTIVPAASLQKTATVSAVSLTKGLGATGSIVVNTAGGVPANAFATINRKLAAGQTVVGSIAPNVVATTAQVASTSSMAATVRPAPARTVATSMTVQELNAAIVNQVRAQGQANQSQLLTTTALAQNQLARVSAQVGGNVQQKLATSTKLTPQHLLMLQRQQQIKQQRSITNLTQIQSQQASAVAQAVQRPVSTPLITNISGTLTPQGTRLQVPKQALSQTRPRTLTEAEMAVFLRQKGGQPKIQTITGATAQVQQVQVSGQGAVARLTTGQIISGTQQIPSQAGTSGQSVATLVKTVSTQGGSVPSVTIPVSAVSSLGLTVPQQKSVQGRVTPLQVRQIVGGQKKQTVTAAQLQAHKVAAIGGVQIPKTQGTPLIIPQKHSQQQVIVQQLQQLVHQSKANQVPSNSATVIATQLVTQAGHTVARLSVPTGSSNTVRTVAPPNLSAIGSVAPQTLITQATASSVPSTVPLHPGIVKNIQEVVVSPQKPLGLQQQLKTLPQATTIRGLPGISLNPNQPTVAVQQLQPTKQHTPPPGVQQAVQQVVQHAHLQSQQRQQLQAAVVQTPVTSTQTSQAPVGDPKTSTSYAMKLRNQK